MLISQLLVRHKAPAPRFAPGLFMSLLVAFTILGQTRPVVGLTGLGTTLIITGVLVELNRVRIWETYRKSYKKPKGLAGHWTKPNPAYYTVNVVLLWPFIIFLGTICLWAAYALY